MLHVEATERRLAVFRSGLRDSLVTQRAEADTRPYLHPLLAPDGVGVLTEDAPPHHSWQHGLYVGLNDVNGVGFWTEGPNDGTFHPKPLAPPVVDGKTVRWTVETAWRTPGRTPLLTEDQTWTLRDHGDTHYTLDLDWRLLADVNVTFGPYAYGGLFLRMPYRPDRGGLATNSEGQTNAGAEAQRARWCAVEMPVEGRNDPAGIALLDHPANPEHPVPWRVDNQLGIAPSRCIAGAWHLAEGETAWFRHRALVFRGPTDTDNIEAEWQAFAAQEPMS